MKDAKEPRILKKGSAPVAMLMLMETAADRHKTIATSKLPQPGKRQLNRTSRLLKKAEGGELILLSQDEARFSMIPTLRIQSVVTALLGSRSGSSSSTGHTRLSGHWG